VHGAEENILNSSRSTDFITPKSEISRIFRDAVLDLSETVPGIRPLVNSGRLSVPCTYDGSPLNGTDHPDLPQRTRPGSPAADAPLGSGWLIDRLGGRFQVVTINCEAPTALDVDGIEIEHLSLDAQHPEGGYLRERYLGDAASAVYLIRPDQHIAARWTHYDAYAVAAALRTSIGRAA
jgi:3-(3-hydroxy-phenyl)propionate hydroxylase